jgi:hypothetical protein
MAIDRAQQCIMHPRDSSQFVACFLSYVQNKALVVPIVVGLTVKEAIVVLSSFVSFVCAAYDPCRKTIVNEIARQLHASRSPFSQGDISTIVEEVRSNQVPPSMRPLPPNMPLPVPPPPPRSTAPDEHQRIQQCIDDALKQFPKFDTHMHQALKDKIKKTVYNVRKALKENPNDPNIKLKLDLLVKLFASVNDAYKKASEKTGNDIHAWNEQYRTHVEFLCTQKVNNQISDVTERLSLMHAKVAITMFHQDMEKTQRLYDDIIGVPEKNRMLQNITNANLDCFAHFLRSYPGYAHLRYQKFWKTLTDYIAYDRQTLRKQYVPNRALIEQRLQQWIAMREDMYRINGGKEKKIPKDKQKQYEQHIKKLCNHYFSRPRIGNKSDLERYDAMRKTVKLLQEKIDKTYNTPMRTLSDAFEATRPKK